MRKIFISSVISGFEEYRNAARNAIELMGDKPVMCEDFGARPYSSEMACISEVEASDIYLLILGDKYGYIGSNGESVTQMEFHAAKAAGKPILAFIQDGPKEDLQDDFRKEVEHFATGFFRGIFQTPADLKDNIVKSLRQLTQAQHALPKEAFEEKINRAVSAVTGHSSSRNPVLCLAFLPQPLHDFDIVDVERRLDSIFANLCSNGVLAMREGYTPECQRDWTSLKTKEASVSFFEDGMVLFLLSPIERRDDFFSGSFAPPSRIINLAVGAFSIIEAAGCWASISLAGMDHVMVKELPNEKLSSISYRMQGDSEAALSKLFIPFTKDAYIVWIEQCLKRFERIFPS